MKGELCEYPYEKYGEHVVALKVQGGNLRLFDAVKFFSENNSKAEYLRVKDEAASFAKSFVETYNRGLKNNG